MSLNYRELLQLQISNRDGDKDEKLRTVFKLGFLIKNKCFIALSTIYIVHL